MRLEINGTIADLGRNVIAITRKVIDLNNLALRNIDITNRLRLPKSNINQQIFNSADRVETNNDGLDVNYAAKIIDQFFIFNGTGSLNEANERYNFQLAESSRDLFNNLNEKINLLNYDDKDFTFSDAEYDNLKLFDDDNIWIWSIIAQNEDTVESKTRFTSGDAGLKYSRPQISFRKLLHDSIEGQGWTIDYDEDIIDRVGMIANATKFYVTSYQKTLDTSYTLAGDQNLTNLDTNDFENDVVVTSTTINIGDTSTIFRLRGDVIADVNVNVKFVATSLPSGKEKTKEFTIAQDQEYVDFKTSEFKPSDADTSVSVEVIISGTGDFEFVDTLLYTIIEEQKLGDLSANNLIGYRVKAFDNMPDKKQIDIFRDAIKITNSIIVPDSFKKLISLKSLNKLSKLNTIDWSDKFNGDEGTYSQKNEISGYARTNNLIYDNDDTVNAKLGFDSFAINNESLEDEEDVLELKYSASDEVEIENVNETVASMLCYDDTERINELNDRLIYIFDDGTDTFTMGRFIELDWRSLKTNYYQTWFDSFARLRIIKGIADLNKLDVIGHDFLKLVYIDKFKSSFFVLEIGDYVAGEVSKVELLKIL